MICCLACYIPILQHCQTMCRPSAPSWPVLHVWGGSWHHPSCREGGLTRWVSLLCPNQQTIVKVLQAAALCSLFMHTIIRLSLHVPTRRTCLKQAVSTWISDSAESFTPCMSNTRLPDHCSAHLFKDSTASLCYNPIQA